MSPERRTPFAQIIITLDEGITTSDTVARAFDGGRTISETVDATETVARAFDGGRAPAETVNVSESIFPALLRSLKQKLRAVLLTPKVRTEYI